MLRFLPLLLLSLLLATPVPSATGELHGTVTRIFDGDTINVAPHGSVRLLGIDAPEYEAGPRDDFYLRRGVSPTRLRSVAPRASHQLRQLLLGRRVRLIVPEPSRDRHGRLLAEVFLADGRLVNRLLLEAGLASAYRKFDYPRKQDFLAAERAARAAGRGLWEME